MEYAPGVWGFNLGSSCVMQMMVRVALIHAPHFSDVSLFSSSIASWSVFPFPSLDMCPPNGHRVELGHFTLLHALRLLSPKAFSDIDRGFAIRSGRRKGGSWTGPLSPAAIALCHRSTNWISRPNRRNYVELAMPALASASKMSVSYDKQPICQNQHGEKLSFGSEFALKRLILSSTHNNLIVLIVAS